MSAQSSEPKKPPSMPDSWKPADKNRHDSLPADKRKPTRRGTRRTQKTHSPLSSSATSLSDEESASGHPVRGNTPLYLNNIPVPPEKPSDNTIHFTLDVGDDIERHLEELSRLKRWGRFKEAIEYFTENLECHLDLPLVSLQYSDLLLEQGSYRTGASSNANRSSYGQKMKCLPIGDGKHGPDLYQLHSDVLGLRAKLFCGGLSIEDLDLLQTDSFWEYLDRRVASTHGSAVPFDSTEVQIIRNQLLIRSCVKDEASYCILPAVRTSCWPQLYNDLLMDGRVWELSDLLAAMFRFFGLRGTFQRLFDPEEVKDSGAPQTIHCLERLLKDWTIDGYDEATELAVLTILVEIMYALYEDDRPSPKLQKDRPLYFARCVQEAEQCAVGIQAHSPHLVKSRPYLQWVLASEHFDREQNSTLPYSAWWEAQSQQFSGLFVHPKYLPSYIPLTTENPGWPAPDFRFPPNENLHRALEASKELLDYDTQAGLIKELICRVEDPRPLFEELDTLHGLVQGDILEQHESCSSQYLLATDETSRRKLFERLESVTSQFQHTPEDDLRLAARWEGIMVQNALARSIFEYAELIDRNARSAQEICHDLPLRPAMIGIFSHPASANRLCDSQSGRSGHWNTPQQSVELADLQERVRGLERELRNVTLRLRLATRASEGEERLNTGEKNDHEKPPGESSNKGAGSPDNTSLRVSHPSQRHKETPSREQGLKSGEMNKKSEAENKAVENVRPSMKGLDKNDYDTRADEGRDLQAPQKPHRYASVTETHDEPTAFAEPVETRVHPGQTGK